MRKLLFLFLDGVGLGSDNPLINPLAEAKMPVLQGLLGGQRLVISSVPTTTNKATLLPLDACLEIQGLPQSATGQATLLTGTNVSALVGEHYGPKPNPEVREHLRKGTIFSQLKQAHRKVDFLNAYPPTYFQAIQSGYRLYATIPQAAVFAGIPLHTMQDLREGSALSADFTAKGWHTHLGINNIPTLSPYQAGKKLAGLAWMNDFSFFEYWLTDFAGHQRNMQTACDLLETVDQVLAGLLTAWEPDKELILITSDHGNMEDLSTRRHTTNPVPALLLGTPGLREAFLSDRPFQSLTDVAPAIYSFIGKDN